MDNKQEEVGAIVQWENCDIAATTEVSWILILLSLLQSVKLIDLGKKSHLLSILTCLTCSDLLAQLKKWVFWSVFLTKCEKAFVSLRQLNRISWGRRRKEEESILLKYATKSFSLWRVNKKNAALHWAVMCCYSLSLLLLVLVSRALSHALLPQSADCLHCFQCRAINADRDCVFFLIYILYFTGVH